MSIGWPLGLLGLLALPAIVWLHRFVVQARRHPVSDLGLWVDALRAGAEGRSPRRPPLTAVLLLELLAATALVAALAQIRLGGPALPPPTVGVVLDTSASMRGGAEGQRPLDLAAALLREVPAGTRIVLAAGWPSPRILADGAVDEALAALAATPAAVPAHDLAPVLALLTGLGIDERWVLTDDPAVALPHTVHLGAPAGNVAFVGASWPEGGAPTVAVQAFGDADVPLTLTVRAEATSTVAVIAPHGTFRALEIPVDGDEVQVELPPDALAVDDQVTLVRPAPRGVGVAITLPDGPARRAFAAAVDAIDTLALADPPALVIGPGDAPARLVLAAGPADHVATQLTADRFSPLMDGVDVSELIWPATAAQPPPGAQVHLTSAEGPVLWQVGTTFTWNLASDAATNLFRREAFVALLTNLGDELARVHGAIAQPNLRAGDALRLSAAPEWPAPRRWLHPDGAASELPADRPLTELGAHRLTAGGADVGRFAVSFADPRESDLTARAPDGPGAFRPDYARAAAPSADEASTWPWLAALAALIAAWSLLGRR